MIKFTEKEKEFLNTREECRVATSHDNIPHVKPVSYIFENEKFYLSTDYETRMYKNVKVNPKAALVIDIYKHGSHKAVLIQGDAKIVENGNEFSKIFKMFYEKFDWVRNDPWKENEAPFIIVIPFSKTSWGLK